LWLLVGIVVLIVSLIVGVQVFSVLYGLILPPLPPIPADSRQIQHDNPLYGQDEWLYGVDQSACDVVRFYAEQHACALPTICTSGANVPIGYDLATCSQTMDFSVFSLAWQADIQPASPPGTTAITVSRQIYWNNRPSD